MDYIQMITYRVVYFGNFNKVRVVHLNNRKTISYSSVATC